MTASAAARDALSQVPDLRVSEPEPGDAVLGVAPALVVRPTSVDQLAEVMGRAHSAGLAVVPRGGGSKLAWADPPRRVDLVVVTGGLSGVLDHSPGDLVAVAGAGTRLAELQRELATHRQWLALDPPEPGATLGGVVATNACGPSVAAHGRPRDLLIGLAVVLADGTLARSGGRVVKNVAGYDLGKLFAGSLGTLGVIVETTFKLQPLPARVEIVSFDLDGQRAGEARELLSTSPIEPSSATLHWQGGRGRLDVGLAGSEAGVHERRRLLAHLLGEESSPDSAEERAAPWGDAALRVGYRVARLADLLEALGREATAEIQVSAGVADVRTDESDARSLVSRLREGLGDDVHVHVRRASPELKRELGSVGALGAPESLLRRVKRELDPKGAMSPGRVPWD